MQSSRVLEYTRCETHGDPENDFRALATMHLRPSGQPRYRCRRCHADKEQKRRERNRPRHNEYMRGWKIR